MKPTRLARSALVAASALLLCHPPARAEEHPAHGRTARRHAPAQAHPPARHVPTVEGKAAPVHQAAVARPKKPAPPPPDPTKGTATGLPLPRFAALRSDEVNLRRGPGTRYPIEWVYKRRELPVEIEREFEVWRLVAAPDGGKGWVHQATLTGRRGFIVTGEEHVLRDGPKEDAGPVARLKPGVVGRILHCDEGAEWCRVQVGEYRGFLKRSDFWGSFAGEAIN